MTFWQLLDTIAVGWQPVSIDGLYPFAETQQRVKALTQPRTADPEFPALTAAAKEDRIEVSFQIPFATRRTSALLLYRPVFRGRLNQGSPVRLAGWFGANASTRFVGLASVLVLAVLGALAWLGPQTPWWLAFIPSWVFGVLPIIFVGTCIVARINGADDIPIIQKNLEYALRGDE